MRKPSANGRTAFINFQSHGDRSFLDGADVALLSGDLKAAGVDNDLLHVVLGEESAEQRLIERLRDYDLVLFERVWSNEVVERLRQASPHAVFVWWMSEHDFRDASADWICTGGPRDVVPALIEFLRGRSDLPPSQARFQNRPFFSKVPGSQPAPLREKAFTPNLHPVEVTPESLPAFRTFTINGNAGCPYETDARKNPLYEGAQIPEGVGRGCAFCVAGRNYSSAPAAVTAARVLEQIRFVRSHAPELDKLVLMDQNPFGYLETVIDQLVTEGVSPFTLLLETRADWLRRSRKSFERSLSRAAKGGLKLAPFLIGIENFSDPELARFNKGMLAEENVAFLEMLWDWHEQFSPTLTLEHCAFGFILLSPWTSREDLRANLEGIRRTRLHKLRGSFLVSRARLYPDTALYYLAKRDGLLVDAYANEQEDNSARYGYLPSAPWRYLHDDVAHFSSLAAELTERMGSRDQLRLFDVLLAAFDEAADWRTLTVDQIERRLEEDPSRPRGFDAPDPVRRRFADFIRPLDLETPFADGWRIGPLTVAAGVLRVRLHHANEEPVDVELAPRRGERSFMVSRHYELRHVNRNLAGTQKEALSTLCRAIVANDR